MIYIISHFRWLEGGNFTFCNKNKRDNVLTFDFNLHSMTPYHNRKCSAVRTQKRQNPSFTRVRSTGGQSPSPAGFLTDRKNQKAMTKTKHWGSRSPGKHKFAAFDFAADDERIETEAKIKLSKFKKKSPHKHISPVSKLTFLNSFAGGEKNILKKIDDEVVHIDHCLGRADEGNIKCDRVSSSGSAKHKSLELNQTEYHELLSSSRESTPCSTRVPGTVTDDKHLSASHSLFPADNEPVIVDSDDDSVTKSRSPKSPSTAKCPACAAAVLLEEQPSKFAPHAHVSEALVVYPDHIIYGSFCSRKSCLEFSPKCIQLKALSISGTTRTHTFKWMLSDIVCIESIWCDGVKTAHLIFHLKYETQRTSDARVLTVAVYNPNWSIVQEAIQSLDIFYMVNWRTSRVETMQNELYAGQKRSEEPFHEVLYPKGDPGAISISKRDVDLLQPETFINDTIIDFYITYLMNNIPSEKRHMFHFFNCFFFQKLIGLDKDPSQACEGKTAFQRIRRWTMKVDIFNKDYIFVPINFSLHWSLIVICHPGEVAGYQDDEMEKLSRVPCILHMDSLKGSHKGLNNLFQSYLCEEWKARHGELAEDVCRKFLDLQFLHLKLPQQENSFDCGLFLLHYVELFMEQAPVNFSPFRLPPRFLCQDWFKPRDVSKKRDHIKNLIYEILKQSGEYGSTDYYKYPSSGIDKEHASAEFIEDICMSITEKGQTSDLCYTVDAECQIMSPPQTHLKSSKFAVSDSVFGPCFTPKAANFMDYHMHRGVEKLTSHVGKMMSPIEEEENREEGFMDITPALDERRPQSELPPLMCPVNDSDKLPYEQPKSSWSSISPQNSPGESEVKSSSFPGEKSVEWIVLDSQDENNSCGDEDDAPGHSSPHRTANTFVLCNLDEDSAENGSNHIHPSSIQKEEEAAETGIKIIDISNADIEKVGQVVEDSEDEEDNIERSKRRPMKTHSVRRLIVDISEDLCI